MKTLLFLIITLYALNGFGQDYLLDKRGSIYYYQGKEYKCKQLGIVYLDHEEIFNLHHNGIRNHNTAKYLAIGGAVTMGVGFLVMLNSGNVYGIIYGGIVVLTGILLEPLALFYLIKGELKTKRARDKFNFKMLEKHGYDSGFSLALGGTREGVGLIFQF